MANRSRCFQILLATTFWLSWPASFATTLKPHIVIPAIVEHIKDGDTISVSVTDHALFTLLSNPQVMDHFSENRFIKNHKLHKQLTNDEKRTLDIRLAQIDAPEYKLGGKAKDKQAFGKESRQGLMEIIPATSDVTLHISAVDKYGRYVADIYTEGVYVNKWMVTRGLAHVYTKYRFDLTLDLQEANARRQKIGLWQQANPQLPSEWRRENKYQPPKIFYDKIKSVISGSSVRLNKYREHFLFADIKLPIKKNFRTEAKNYLETRFKANNSAHYTVTFYNKREGYLFGHLYQSPETEPLNHQLVAKGLAWVFPRYVSDDSKLYQLQNEAKKAKRGFWHQDNPTAPWLAQFKEERITKQRALKVLKLHPNLSTEK